MLQNLFNFGARDPKGPKGPAMVNSNRCCTMVILDDWRNQHDLTMGGVFPIFHRYWQLSYRYFYGAQLICFHIIFSTFVGNCLKRKLHWKFYVKTNQLWFICPIKVVVRQPQNQNKSNGHTPSSQIALGAMLPDNVCVIFISIQIILFKQAVMYIIYDPSSNYYCTTCCCLYLLFY